jgi:hypothetical protein
VRGGGRRLGNESTKVGTDVDAAEEGGDDVAIPFVCTASEIMGTLNELKKYFLVKRKRKSDKEAVWKNKSKSSQHYYSSQKALLCL